MPNVSSTSRYPTRILNFKFRIKWQGKYVAGLSKCEAPWKYQHQGRRHFRRRAAIQHEPHPAGPDQVRADRSSAASTQDLEFETWIQTWWPEPRRPGNGELARHFPSATSRTPDSQRRGADWCTALPASTIAGPLRYPHDAARTFEDSERQK